MTDRSLGKFYVSWDCAKVEPGPLAKAMSSCFIMRAEYLPHMAAYEYIAYAPHFDLLQPSDAVPTYDLIVHRDPDNEASIEWKRRD